MYTSDVRSCLYLKEIKVVSVLPHWKQQLFLWTHHCCSIPLLVCVCEAAVCACGLCVNWSLLRIGLRALTNFYLSQLSSLMQLSCPSLLPHQREKNQLCSSCSWEPSWMTTASVYNMPHLIAGNDNGIVMMEIVISYRLPVTEKK